MFHRRPLVINQLKGVSFVSLARLSSLEAVSRGMLVGIIPVLLYETFQDKSIVASVYFAGALMTMLITLNLAVIERVVPRRWIMSCAFVFLIVSAFLFLSTHTLAITIGIGLRSAAASIFTVCVSLYVMDYIRKQEFTNAESKRMLYNGFAWVVSPLLGSWLWHKGYFHQPFVIAMLFALLAASYFWHLRLGDNPVIQPAKSSMINPVQAVRRYFGQKRLRIAYLISISRSSFWVTLFVYGPIYTLEAGLPGWVGGALLSFVSGLLFFSPLIGKLARIVGTRTLICTGLMVCSVSLITLASLGDPTPAGVAFFILASCGAIILDVLGNIPFMRSVKLRERSAMTVVFSTWREGSELATPAIIGLTLLVAPMWVFYLLLALVLLLTAYLTTFLPRRI